MIVFLESPVAAGKSTAAQYLSNRYPVFLEPVDMWTNHLKGVYGAAASEWLLPMQMLALTTRHELLLRAAEISASGATVVVERSPRSDAIFAQDLAGEDKAAYDVVRLRYEKLMGSLDVAHVYLRADPETCIERIALRGRPSERGITIERTREMHRRHDVEFANDITIDANRDADSVFKDVLRTVQELSDRASPEDRIAL